MSSALACDRQASADAVATEIEAHHISTVKSAYVSIDTCKVERITYFLPTNSNHTLASRQIICSAKQAQTDFMMICDKRCSQKGLMTVVWVPGWEAPLAKLSEVLSLLTNRPSPPSPPPLIAVLTTLYALLAGDAQGRRPLTFFCKWRISDSTTKTRRLPVAKSILVPEAARLTRLKIVPFGW